MMMRYEKDGGLNYPVLPGDIWVAGAAILICGDLARVDVQELCRRFGRPALVYCDPPWNAGNATTFRRKAGLDDTANYPALMAGVVQVAAQATAGAVIEMGVRQADEVAEMLTAAMDVEVAQVAGTYYRRHPMVYLVALYNSVRRRDTARLLEGVDDEDAPRLTLTRAIAAGGLIVDPYFGRGLTPVTARATGHPFWGVELNPYRMSVTLRKLTDTGLRPEKRGELQCQPQPQPRFLTAS
jgi:hypothetical protein